MRGCPSIDSLESALAADSPGSELAAHVQSCPRCRARIEQIRENQSLLKLVNATESRQLAAALDAGAATRREPPSGLAGYEFIGEIHRGGQGVVFKALQKATKRIVAVKVVLRGAFATPRQRARFEREIEIAARLRHPHVVTIHESGMTDDGSLYFVMEYVEGEPLDAYLKRARATPGGGLTPDDALRVFCKICDAVNYAHQRGIIHRDLKPANILIDALGEPRVLDFGLAKAVGLNDPDSDARSARTRTGEFLGTFSYAAPEQLRGDPDQVDTRTDVYALGILLFEMLTGQFPYPVDGSLSAIIRSITETAPAPPSRLAPGIGEELDTIVVKALAKERERRYQSAGALQRDVQSFLAGEPIDAKRDSHWYVLRKTARRHRTALGVATAIVLLLIGFGVSMGFLARHLARERDRARSAERAVAENARRVAAALYDSQVERGRALGAAGGVSAAEELLWRAFVDPPGGAAARASGADIRDPARRQAFWALWELYNAAPCQRTWATGAHTTTRMAVSDNGRILALGGDPGPIETLDVLTGARVRSDGPPVHMSSIILLDETGARLCGIEDNRRISIWRIDPRARRIERETAYEFPNPGILRLAASRDLRRIAAADADSRLWYWSDTIAAPPRPLVNPSAGVFSLAFSPDAHRLAVGTASGGLTMWGLDASPEPVVNWSLPAHRAAVRGLCFSPDGACLASAGGDADNTIRLTTVRDGTLIRSMAGHTSHVNSIAFRADGRRLVSTSFDKTARIWDVPSGRPVATLFGHSAAVIVARFVGDGDEVISAGHDGAARLWDSPDRGAFTSLREPRCAAMSLAVARDGQTLYVGGVDGTIRALDVATGQVRYRQRAHGSMVATLCVSPDGALLASCSVDQRACLWDAATGRRVAEIRDLDGPAVGLAFHPDGKTLAVGCDNGVVRVWDRTDPARVHVLRGSARFLRRPALAFSPDGATLAACDGLADVSLWDWATETVRVTLRGHSGQTRGVAYSPDGRLLTTAGDDATVRLWDAGSGAPVATLEGHGGDVFAVAFSPDGAMIASGGRDRTIRLWDVVSHRGLATLSGHADMVFSLAFGDGGAYLASSSADGVVGIWDLAHGDARVAGNLDYQLTRLDGVPLPAKARDALRHWAARAAVRQPPRFDWSLAAAGGAAPAAGTAPPAVHPPPQSE
ncbi:MAG: protein kinase [Phycisphaerae bacterium]